MTINVEQTYLTSRDIPSSFPEPLRRALIDQSEIINQIVDELNATSELAEENSGRSSLSQDVVNEISRLINENTQLINENSVAISNNTRLIAELSNKLNTSDDDIAFIKDDYISKSKVLVQSMQSPLSVTGNLLINDAIVLAPTQTGWSASYGTQIKGGIDSDQAYPVSATPTQAEVQAIAAGLVETRQVLLATIDALTNYHKLIGPTPTP